MHLKRLFIGFVALGLLFATGPLPASAAPTPTLSSDVGVCDPWFPTRCLQAGPFIPDDVQPAPLNITVTSASVQLFGKGSVLVVTNIGSNDGYVRLGGVSAVAATTDLYVGAGRSLVIGRGSATYLAGIAGTSTSTLVVQQGFGTPVISGGGGGGGGGGGSVTITGTLPAYASTPTFNLGTLNGAATAALQSSVQKTLGSITGNASFMYDNLGAPVDWAAPALVKGSLAAGVTAADAPVVEGCRAATAAPTAVADGQVTYGQCSVEGKRIVMPYSIKELIVRGTASGTDTAAHTILAAGGANIKTYVTGLQCSNTSATDTLVTMSDGAASIFIVPHNSGTNLVFTSPLVTAANTAFSFTAGTGVTTLYCNAQGYTGP